ncbi:MAG: winged helix-turn-helix domain-containing protein [Burkholderiaceae bacterium]
MTPAPDSNPAPAVSFGGLVYSEPRGCVVDDAGRDRYLRPQSLAVFRLLAAHADSVVTKTRLFEAVWPGVAVTDDSIVQCIADIRRMLGGNAHRILRTFPRRGYMLVSDPLPGPGGPPPGWSGTAGVRRDEAPPEPPTLGSTRN